MYKNLTLINGVILAIMVFFNGMLSNITGPYIGTLIYHIIGLFFIILIALIKKNSFCNLKKIPFILFLPGILSVVTILLNNISIPQIGVTLAGGVGLFGQLVMSSLVEHFGLFGMPINKLKRGKVLGLSIISLGIIAMITM